MKNKLSIILISVAILISCGGGSSGPPPTRGQLMQQAFDRYERCLEENNWTARQCRDHYERQMAPLLER